MVHFAPSWCTSTPYTVAVVYNVPWVNPHTHTYRLFQNYCTCHITDMVCNNDTSSLPYQPLIDMISSEVLFHTSISEVLPRSLQLQAGHQWGEHLFPQVPPPARQPWHLHLQIVGMQWLILLIQHQLRMEQEQHEQCNRYLKIVWQRFCKPAKHRVFKCSKGCRLRLGGHNPVITQWCMAQFNHVTNLFSV